MGMQVCSWTVTSVQRKGHIVIADDLKSQDRSMLLCQSVVVASCAGAKILPEELLELSYGDTTLDYHTCDWSAWAACFFSCMFLMSVQHRVSWKRLFHLLLLKCC